ncbi:recombinase family protein [Aneurinibacillus aneurinilyticus]|jgi:DNA invertase Pin-like site-specific DNA recombinase|uniref:recombinase family protein n=1 Tax=Aneurinibacillus aneurinilyticus TaxID=1391 RepID=UPI0023F6F9FB|nr:recombinase family protein [Aneurinibacillus aneurinilyticus]MCI1693808.1 recombinase family protein [Aneurinibacillus aneurinilyticus]
MEKQKYAVYVRVSTDKDEQISSIENQIDICRNWLERNGHEWDEDCIYKDEGISGTLFLERPAIQLILEKAKKKEINMVVFKSISRLARDMKDSLEIREVFTAYNVRLISIEEGFDSFKAGRNDISFEIWSLFAAQYSRTLSAGVSAALAAKVRRGGHIGKTPYGYDKEDGKLVINEGEAEIVQKIYGWYGSGWGFKRITQELNDRGIPSKLNPKWQVTSVQRLIQNRIYCGDFILNQYGTVKVGGRKKQIRNPEEQWLIFRDHHPPIVSRETWEKANSKKHKATRRRITPWNELRGLMKCAVCGCNMVILQGKLRREVKPGQRKYFAYVKCSAYRRAGEHACVNHVPIQYEEIRELIIERLLETGKTLSMNLKSEIEKLKEEEIKILNKKIETMSEKKKSLVDLFLEKLITKEEFEQKRTELDRELQHSEEELFILQRTEHVQQNEHNIKEAFLQLENTDQDLYHVFNTLIEEIKIEQDGTMDIKYTFRQPIIGEVFSKGTH